MDLDQCSKLSSPLALGLLVALAWPVLHSCWSLVCPWEGYWILLAGGDPGVFSAPAPRCTQQ